MLPFSHSRFRITGLKVHNKSLYAACMMLFFYALFDGTVSYTAPLAIAQTGASETTLGLIIGSSSMFGAAFDFLICKISNNMHFRRVYLLMLALCFTYPLVLSQAKTVWIFLIAMAIWGFYFDLMKFGSFDFVGRKSTEKEHTSYFGKINVFKGLGYLLAPLIVGLVLGGSSTIDWRIFGLMLIFLTMALSYYLVLMFIHNKEKKELIKSVVCERINLLLELRLWKSIGRKLLPVLVLTMFFNIFDSFFWTLGPILAESYQALHPFNGLFLTAYILPTLLMGWFVGNFTKRLGKKKTAFLSFFIGSCILGSFFLLQTPILILGAVFLASLFVGLTLPAMDGAFADYLAESPLIEKEIAAIEDLFGNFGYIIGPITAGILADHLGNAATFSALGIMCAVVAVILFVITPRKINLHIQPQIP